jgi:hypothetical protein
VLTGIWIIGEQAAKTKLFQKVSYPETPAKGLNGQPSKSALPGGPWRDLLKVAFFIVLELMLGITVPGSAGSSSGKSNSSSISASKNSPCPVVEIARA